MMNYLNHFNTKYDNLKLYVLLYPYNFYIEKYELGNSDISIYTKNNSMNKDIKDHIRKFFTYKKVSVNTKKTE